MDVGIGGSKSGVHMLHLNLHVRKLSPWQTCSGGLHGDFLDFVMLGLPPRDIIGGQGGEADRIALSRLTRHDSQLTTHNSQFTTHNSQLTTHNVLLIHW